MFICKRAIACLLSTQIACDIENDDYEESVQLFGKLLNQYGTYSEQDVIAVAWTYEAYWSLVWALGLVDNLSDASTVCDCEKAIRLVGDCDCYETFQQNCKPRDVEEILDMLDLYYRYDWAVTEKRLNPDTPIGNLNPDVVVERRRGLEWLISDKEDCEDNWFEISLDT